MNVYELLVFYVYNDIVNKYLRFVYKYTYT